MNTTAIKSLILSIIPESEIHSIDIKLNQHNDQLETLDIVFKDSYNALPHLGHLMDKLETYTQNGEYGDLTEATIKHTTYHDLPNGDLTTAWYTKTNIDS